MPYNTLYPLYTLGMGLHCHRGWMLTRRCREARGRLSVEQLGEYEDWAENPFCRTGVVFKRMLLCELRQLVELPLSEDQEKGLIDIDACSSRTHYTDQEVWQLLEMISSTSNTAQFQALSRPQQKHYLYEVHEQGVGPRTLSRLTGVPYAIVQRATSSRATSGRTIAGVCESTPWDAEYETNLDEGDFAEYLEY